VERERPPRHRQNGRADENPADPDRSLVDRLEDRVLEKKVRQVVR
jgi:hypothetical protein